MRIHLSPHKICSVDLNLFADLIPGVHDDDFGTFAETTTAAGCTAARRITPTVHIDLDANELRRLPSLPPTEETAIGAPLVLTEEMSPPF